MGLVDVEHASAVVSALAAIGSLVVSIYAVVRITEVRHSTNSMKDELVAAVRAEAHRLGVMEGRKQQIDEEPDAT